MVKNAIKVYARLKPEKNRKNIVNYQVRHRPKKNLEEDFLFLVTPSQKMKDYPDHRAESWNFSFFRIFEESATQEDVFKNVAQPVVESALDGYNGTIFAYGQTASGKTYSITGKQERHEYLGIVPRSLLYLFDMIQKRPENVYSVEVAYLEIYNENGYDLLDRKQQRDFPVTRFEDLPRITVQEDEIGRLHLKNLTFHCVGSAEDAFELLLVGDSNRITVETPMNPESSRSHCIFTIVICTKKFGADEYKRAKVHLVDLAGSERVYKCSISGTILTEAKHINLSLHYLEQVIVCLGQESAGHIPYRNSLLTSILRDSLGGNCLTTMLATISITSYNLEETVSTCRFAQRVALIKNDVRLVLEKDVHSENALLRLENEKLRQQIKEMTKDIKVEELSAEDKQNLDYQIKNFLESNEQIKVDNNLKKIAYCFESFKKIFKLYRDPNSCLKKLEYYKDLVIQRDKEISLLIDLIKKEQKKGTEGSDEEKFEDILKTTENSNTAVSTVPTETNDRISSTVNNILNNFSSRKQKAKSKVTKPLSQRNLKTNFDQNISTDVDTSITADQTNSTEQFLINKQNFLPCNVVKLSLNDSTETSQQTVRKKERKKVKQGKIESSMKKIVRSKQNTELSSSRSEIERTEDPFLEIKDSTPVYQRYLSFNVPKNLNNSTVGNLSGRKSINCTDETQNRIKIDSNEQNFIYKPCTDLKLNSESKISRKREESSDRPNECFNIDQIMHSKLIDTNLRISNDSINPRRCAKPMENEAKESQGQSARSNVCSFDKMDNSRSKTGEKRTSISSFTVDYPEQSYFGEQTSIKKAEVGQTFDYDANRSVEGSLPLTGDPEIDEEIIAFYKAKRSGGTY